MPYDLQNTKLGKSRGYWDRGLDEWGGGDMQPDTADVLSSGTVTLTGGASGSVDGIQVNSVEIMSALENFDTDLPTTATAVAANITANTSAPDYNAVAVGAVITITAVATGDGPNGFSVVSSTTTITSVDVYMFGGATQNIAYPKYSVPNTTATITYDTTHYPERNLSRKYQKRNLSTS